MFKIIKIACDGVLERIPYLVRILLFIITDLSVFDLALQVKCNS